MTHAEPRPVDRQEDLSALLSGVDWTDAFVKEVHITSLSGVTSDGRWVIAADAKPDLRLLIVTLDNKHPGIEFLFSMVEDLSLSFCVDIEPEGRVRPAAGIEFYLNRGVGSVIRSRALQYRFLDSDCWNESYSPTP